MTKKEDEYLMINGKIGRVHGYGYCARRCVCRYGYDVCGSGYRVCVYQWHTVYQWIWSLFLFNYKRRGNTYL